MPTSTFVFLHVEQFFEWHNAGKNTGTLLWRTINQSIKLFIASVKLDTTNTIAS